MYDLSHRCTVCRCLLDEEDLFCPNCGTEAPFAAQRSVAQAGAMLSTCNFQCEGCGASMSYDARAQSLRCPFCGSIRLKSQADKKTLSPQRVVPFRVGQNQAVAAVRAWLGRGMFRPSNLATDAIVVQTQRVYVPYWVFQAKTHTYWTADSSRTPPGARASWYPMTGEHRGSYQNLLVGASGVLTPGETEGLCPFYLDDSLPPEQVDLDNVIYEQFSIPRKYARPLAVSGIQLLEQQACRKYVPGSIRNPKTNVLIEALSSYPVLLPVWIMAYRYREKVFRILVNGQTGRVTGVAPISWAKVAVFVLMCVAGAIGLLIMLGLLLRG